MRTIHIKRHLPLLAAVVVAGLGARAATAQTISFDENGKGTFVTPNGLVQPLPALGNIVDPFDPGSGIHPLAYDMTPVLPGALATNGDVNLFDATNAPPSDLLRWFRGLLLVYSDLPEAGEITAAADVGLPTVRQQNSIGRLETGPEAGPNGLFGYAPAPGMPGSFPASAAQVTYDFTSDPATPEPQSFALIAVGGCAALLRRRRRRALGRGAVSDS